jgi:hypothetical protein
VYKIYFIRTARVERVKANDPKINRVLPLPHGNYVAKFGKDPIYRTLQ